MKLISYKTENKEHLGAFVNGHVYNLNACDKLIPDNMKKLCCVLNKFLMTFHREN